MICNISVLSNYIKIHVHTPITEQVFLIMSWEMFHIYGSEVRTHVIQVMGSSLTRDEQFSIIDDLNCFNNHSSLQWFKMGAVAHAWLAFHV